MTDTEGSSGSVPAGDTASNTDSASSTRVDTDRQPRRLRAPLHRIEKRMIGVWTLQALVFPGLLLAGALVAYALWPAARSWLVVVVAVLGVLTLVSIAVEPWWRYAVHRWETTEEAVYARTGWLVRVSRVAPLSRVQTVDSVRGPFEQIFGLATLRVTTASSSGAIEINGLDKDVAERVVEQLTAITERTPGDAT